MWVGGGVRAARGRLLLDSASAMHEWLMLIGGTASFAPRASDFGLMDSLLIPFLVQQVHPMQSHRPCTAHTQKYSSPPLVSVTAEHLHPFLNRRCSSQFPLLRLCVAESLTNRRSSVIFSHHERPSHPSRLLPAVDPARLQRPRSRYTHSALSTQRVGAAVALSAHALVTHAG